MHNKKRGVVMIASKLSKFLYYVSRSIHILILPILYSATLWYPTGRWWEILGLILLLTICFYSLIFKKNIKMLFIVRSFSYFSTALLFFPANFFTTEYGIDYRVIVFYDMCFLFLVDLWIFLQNKSENNSNALPVR